MTKNEELARVFEEYADLLDAQGDDFRPRSYRRAAESIRTYPSAIEDVAAEGTDALEDIEGVGEAIAAKIVEYLETGKIDAIEETRAELPVDMAALTSVEGVGPRTVGDLYRELGVTDLDELEAAARDGQIRALDGYGPKRERNILDGIPFARRAGERELLGDALPIGEEVRSYLSAAEAVERCELAGSLRRWRETIGDVDVLAAGTDHEAIVDRFLAWETATEEIESGSTKASLRAAGMRVDLRVVDPDEWGSALQYFTGSKEHNIRLRNYAIERGFKVNEYGLFDVSGVPDQRAGRRVGNRVAGGTEEGIYEALGLTPMAPELREDTGEINAAEAGTLPELVAEADVRGDLHVHTTWSDGDLSVAETIDAAAAFGHDYVCISDHASGPGVVGGMGLDDDEIEEQVSVVREAGDDRDIDVLAGVEANIDADGGLSVGDEALEELDVVIASPHSRLDGDGTDRLITAIEHPAVDVIGHPTGRLLNQRPGMTLDVDAIAEAATEHGTALEVNANPHRIDLDGDAVRRAVETGARIAVNTDAHRPVEFAQLRYGVHTARRGWAEADDVITTWDIDDLRAFLR